MKNEVLDRKLPELITSQYLRNLHACWEATQVFREEFPDGDLPTRTTLIRCAAVGLPISWAARVFLVPAALKEFRKQKRIIQKVCWLSEEEKTDFKAKLANLLADILEL